MKIFNLYCSFLEIDCLRGSISPKTFVLADKACCYLQSLKETKFKIVCSSRWIIDGPLLDQALTHARTCHRQETLVRHANLLTDPVHPWLFYKHRNVSFIN